MSFLEKLFGSNEREVNRLRPLVVTINSFEVSLQSLSLDELKNKSVLFRERLAAGATLDDILPEAYAVVREVAKRVIGERHYDVQMLGGIALHQGKIAEMKTGGQDSYFYSSHLSQCSFRKRCSCCYGERLPCQA